MAMLRIASRNSRGMLRSASATMASNFARCTGFPRLALALADQRLVIIAVVAHHALIAERLGLADPPAVQDQRVRRLRPVGLLHRSAELLLDDLRLVARGDADAVRHSQYVAVDRQ